MNKVTIELSNSDILHILECTTYLDACGTVQKIVRKIKKSVKKRK